MAYHMHMYECLHKRSMRVLQTHTHTHSKIACAVVHGEARLFPRHVHHIFAKKKKEAYINKQENKRPD